MVSSFVIAVDRGIGMARRLPDNLAHRSSFAQRPWSDIRHPTGNPKAALERLAGERCNADGAKRPFN
jgi:hypothetical protein